MVNDGEVLNRFLILKCLSVQHFFSKILSQYFIAMILSELAKFLETNSGRDKVMRLLCYSSKWAAGVSSSPTSAVKFDRFSNQLSACRALLRLFDDIPMFHCTIQYGLGREEKDKVLRSFDLLSNIIDQSYYPIEHLAWAIENEYISVKDNPWSTSSTVFWVISIYLSLMRNIRCLTVLQDHKNCVKGNSSASLEMPQLLKQQHRYMMSIIKCSLDLVHAVNCLPKGYLWGGKLVKWQVGAVGTISSLIGLYMALRRKSS